MDDNLALPANTEIDTPTIFEFIIFAQHFEGLAKASKTSQYDKINIWLGFGISFASS